MKRTVALLMGLFTLINATHIYAIDENGKFAIKGVGNVSCQRFVNMVEQPNSHEKFMFVGWMNGYITAQNQHLKDNFDVVAWQDSETLGGYLVNHCRQNPTLSFFQAATQMVNELYKKRIDKFMNVTDGLTKNDVQQVYVQVVAKVQTRLKEMNYYQGPIDGKFNEAFINSVGKYKKEKGLEAKVLLDQKTLHQLLQ